MKSILEEFANDNLHHNSRHFKWNLAYDRAVHQIADAEKALMETLDERQRTLLENFTDARDDVFLLDQTDQFV